MLGFPFLSWISNNTKLSSILTQVEPLHHQGCQSQHKIGSDCPQIRQIWDFLKISFLQKNVSASQNVLKIDLKKYKIINLDMVQCDPLWANLDILFNKTLTE